MSATLVAQDRKTLIVFLAVRLSAVGALWFVLWLGYNISIASGWH